MRIPSLPSHEITPEALYLRRREFIRRGVAGGLALSLSSSLLACRDGEAAEARPDAAGGKGTAEVSTTGPTKLDHVKPAPAAFRVDDEWTDEKDATSYNNFYEFGTDKRDPEREARDFRTKPWSVAIEGEVGKPGSVPLETLLAPHPLEERIYRLRCVEAWSMVIPWIGIPLGDVLARFDPGSKAKYVAFETLYDPERMPGQRKNLLGQSTLDWPYREGLRLDEAMHPLTILAVGMYGKTLPSQNGAPLRLVVPWKYGFKSIKSIVRIRLTDQQPVTTWNELQPREYGFYANVNPDVDHPRWSQKRERRIGEFGKRKTLPFNGYAEQVASLYAGMDLHEFF